MIFGSASVSPGHDDATGEHDVEATSEELVKGQLQGADSGPNGTSAPSWIP